MLWHHACVKKSTSVKTPRAKKPAKPTPASAAKKKAPPKAAKTASPARAAKSPVAARRADYGAPIEQFFEKRSGELGAVLAALRVLIDEAAPDAIASLKWGMPFYTLDGETLCAVAAFKAHVNLILPGGPGTFSDPDGLLEGEGKTGQHLKLRTRKELPDKAVRAWLRVAARNARAKAGD